MHVNISSALSPPKSRDDLPSVEEWSPFRLYRICLFITLTWVAVGTAFYSIHNSWPVPQAFFYSVDAGMSIGFCTDVKELTVSSKAFTIVYILLGASWVGGALVLFIRQAMEGLANTAKVEYVRALELDAFQRADVGKSGYLTRDEFKDMLLRSWKYKINGSSSVNNVDVTPESKSAADDTSFDAKSPEFEALVHKMWDRFDEKRDGIIHRYEFLRHYHEINRLLAQFSSKEDVRTKDVPRYVKPLLRWMERCKAVLTSDDRIYVVCVLYVAVGVLWGMKRQHWDVVTATHFAVSALATGGLTAPPVNEDGILPAEPAIFCGVFCLFGIPLLALTLGHFAQDLVKGSLVAAEYRSISKPLSREEFEYARHLCTRDDVVHLSDFVVLQLLRQGKLTPVMVELMKGRFEELDSEGSGVLTMEQATRA